MDPMPIQLPSQPALVSHRPQNIKRPLLFANLTPPPGPSSSQSTPQDSFARLNTLAEQYPVIQTMLDLVDIPSATPQTDPRFETAVNQKLLEIRDLITQKFQALGVTNIVKDPKGSLIVRLPGSPGYENRRPLMLTAHMDIVAGDPTNPTRSVQKTVLVKDGKEFIATDGTTTLGADDKGGIAMILDTVARLQGKHPEQKTPLPHIPLEILFSPDEESSCNSLKTLDTSQFNAKQVLVVDEFDDFTVTTGLASAVVIDIQALGIQGGHSGADITKANRINAILLMGEIAKKLGSGVIAMHPQVPSIPLISKNIGLFNGGSAYNAIPENAKIGIMMRSASKEAQQAELERMEKVLKQIEKKYQKLQPGLTLKMTAEEEYPAWENPNSALGPLAVQASQAMNGPAVKIGPIHAAAQASILANKANAFGEKFDAVLIGPHIEEAHTVRERIDWQSLVKSRQWLGQMIQTFTFQPQQ
ncbi:MAG: M20/M25/M40 family metallo-hydrolase [Cyanobacteria bacterium]|nr:M20/M25/M40 family metallo-hydrolase [Cyanobacteriota bacterium]